VGRLRKQKRLDNGEGLYYDVMEREEKKEAPHLPYLQGKGKLVRSENVLRLGSLLPPGGRGGKSLLHHLLHCRRKRETPKKDGAPSSLLEKKTVE